MTNREKHISHASQIYMRENQLLEKIKQIEATPPASNLELLNEYSLLVREYRKLLKQTIKITGVGDANQKKLLLAYEQIESQQYELSLAYNKLEMIARTDPLTELSNRRYFLERFQDEINRFERSGISFSIVLCDIDDFKIINDTYGHDCGDIVLVAISDILRSQIRKQDLVGRWGGEEFILLLNGSKLEGAKIAAETIRKCVAQKEFSYNGHDLSVTMTFGVAPFDGTTNIDGCIKNADIALYQGKTANKNCVVPYCHPMDK